MNLSIPLNSTATGLLRSKDTKKSIDNFLSVLLSTPCGSCASDPDFGFVFNNLRFEIINESEGVVYAIDDDRDTNLYEKKLSGTSKNLNTFAADLKEAISKYEQRLTNLYVSMTYVREQRNILVSIKGTIVESGEDYQFKSNIKIWN